MTSTISRRDFLKLALVFSASATGWTTTRMLRPRISSSDGKPNIIMLVCDTMSARNLSVYGYPRKTTPSLEKFAQHANVYHSHYSGGSFTTAGTASLLTGMYPWSHRAINQMGLVDRRIEADNVFDLIGEDYYRLGFTQNMAADVLLGQFFRDIEDHIPTTSFSLRPDTLMGDRFPNDTAVAVNAYDDFLFDLKNQPGLPGSLLFGLVYKAAHLRREGYYRYGFSDYPLGLPIRKDCSLAFLNETVYDGLKAETKNLSDNHSPFFAYFHLWSPHEPYKPRKEFLNLFKDDYKPLDKPNGNFSYGIPANQLRQYRNYYDRYIANVDDEIGKFMDSLEAAGLLQNSYVIFTSDHGQMFERGVHGHITPYLYDPLIHIPLLISAPGQNSRKDIYAPTSCIDVLPTVLNIAGQKIPSEYEGHLLPELGGETSNQGQSIFSVEAKYNSAFLALTKVTVAMIKGDYKLIYYKGYPGYDNVFELYNLHEDLEEMHNLITAEPSTAAGLKDELLAGLASANKPFQKS